MCFGDEVVKAIYDSRTATVLITWEKAKTWDLGYSSQLPRSSARTAILIICNHAVMTF
jgi:hypothetical protein